MKEVLNKVLSEFTGPRNKCGVTTVGEFVTPSSRLGPVGALLTLFLLFSHLATAQTIRPTTFDDRNICEGAKGVWRQFGNGCADNCETKFDKFAMCTNALVFACDCGKNRCWNGETCLALKDYKKIYDIEAAKNQKILDAAKEKRKADALANEQAIITKLTEPKNPDGTPQKPAAVKAAPTPAPVAAQQPVPVDPSVPTSPITEIMLPEPVNEEPVKVEIPPFLLKKQAQEEAKKAEEKKKSEGSKSTIIDSSMPPGLPTIPLPN